jgi:hypothetical protein
MKKCDGIKRPRDVMDCRQARTRVRLLRYRQRLTLTQRFLLQLGVDYLLARQAEKREGRDWARFSGEHVPSFIFCVCPQLAAQYADADAIYDKD